MESTKEVTEMSEKNRESEQVDRKGTAVPILPSGIGTRINDACERVGGQQKLADLTGMSVSTVRRYISESTEMTLGKLAQISGAAGVSLEWLIFGQEATDSGWGKFAWALQDDVAEDPDEVKRREEKANSVFGLMRHASEFSLIPRYNVRASAGHGAEIETEEIVANYVFRRDWLSSMGLQADKLALITAHGESMEPEIRDGAMILVDLRQKTVEREGVYVLSLDSWLMAKIVQRDVDGTLYIRSRHPAYRELVVPPERVGDVRVIGRAVWTGRILS